MIQQFIFCTSPKHLHAISTWSCLCYWVCSLENKKWRRRSSANSCLCYCRYWEISAINSNTSFSKNWGKKQVIISWIKIYLQRLIITSFSHNDWGNEISAQGTVRRVLDTCIFEKNTILNFSHVGGSLNCFANCGTISSLTWINGNLCIVLFFFSPSIFSPTLKQNTPTLGNDFAERKNSVTSPVQRKNGGMFTFHWNSSNWFFQFH